MTKISIRVQPNHAAHCFASFSHRLPVDHFEASETLERVRSSVMRRREAPPPPVAKKSGCPDDNFSCLAMNFVQDSRSFSRPRTAFRMADR